MLPAFFLGSVEPNFFTTIFKKEIVEFFVSTGLLALIVGSLVKFVKDRHAKYLKYVAAQEKEREERGLRTISECVDELNRVRTVLGCQKILVMYTEDSGGIPAPGTQLFSSVLFESTDSDMFLMKPAFVRQILDDDYMKVIYDVYQGKYINYFSESEINSYLLKKMFTSFQSSCFSIFKIGSNEKRTKFYYLITAWQSKLDQPEDVVENEIRGLSLFLQSRITN